MAAPVEPAAEALAALAVQPVHPAQLAEAAAPAAAAAAEVPVEVLNPPQAARNNDEVLIILSLACSSVLVLGCLLTPLFHAFWFSVIFCACLLDSYMLFILLALVTIGQPCNFFMAQG